MEMSVEATESHVYTPTEATLVPRQWATEPLGRMLCFPDKTAGTAEAVWQFPLKCNECVLTKWPATPLLVFPRETEACPTPRRESTPVFIAR